MVQLAEILTLEHELICEALTCLQSIADECAADGRLREHAAREVLDFFCVFVDQCHRRKVERCLFAVMARQEFPTDYGPLGVLISEREQARRHLRNMIESIDGAALGHLAAVGRFINHARLYVELLRNHIRTEDKHVFPLANQRVTESDQRSLSAHLGRTPPQQREVGNRKTYARLPRRIASRRYALQEQAISTELNLESRC